MNGLEPGPARLARHPVVLIAAVARNGVIGRDGALPWRLPGDLAYFRRMTMGHPVVMGRRTFDETGRPLPGRPTIVVSADRRFAPAGATVARTLADAFAAADDAAAAIGAEAVMVAGGGVIYAATIARADRLLVTLVDADVAGDTAFPAIDPEAWMQVEHAPGEPARPDAPGYSFTRWERRAPSWQRPPHRMAGART